ncbi:YcbK family protein [Inquilinus sp. NPDC058860]|uniref:YcbK family protein n=1 Tax=Inquilinus sp. NPDC058860 TaxID=3346652 RepID=UPI0036B6B6F4
MPADLSPVTRRRALLGLAALPFCAAAAPAVDPTGERRLKLYNPHTDERFDDVYAVDGAVSDDARKRLNRLLRDHHVDKATDMDPGVFDLLWLISRRYQLARDRRVTINLHSGYRTPETNEKLRPEGAARNSLHMQGKAVDLSVQGYGMVFLANHARAVASGGLGLYWRSDFVHLDTGPKRVWYKRF